MAFRIGRLDRLKAGEALDQDRMPPRAMQLKCPRCARQRDLQQQRDDESPAARRAEAQGDVAGYEPEHQSEIPMNSRSVMAMMLL